jgi:flagellar basal-body rod modification protein FlgD
MAYVNGISTNATIFEATIKTDTGNDTLGKEDFLKLLVAQLTHQDPTNPMQDTEFVAQLATYSGLEQQMTMNKNLETLITSQNLSTAAMATSLIGSVVSYVDAEGNYQMGQVAFLDIVGGEINLILNDAYNTSIPFNSVQQVGYPFQQASTDTSGSSDTSDDSGAE